MICPETLSRKEHTEITKKFPKISHLKNFQKFHLQCLCPCLYNISSNSFFFASAALPRPRSSGPFMGLPRKSQAPAPKAAATVCSSITGRDGNQRHSSQAFYTFQLAAGIHPIDSRQEDVHTDEIHLLKINKGPALPTLRNRGASSPEYTVDTSS